MRRFLMLVACCAAVVGLVACGGDDDDVESTGDLSPDATGADVNPEVTDGDANPPDVIDDDATGDDEEEGREARDAHDEAGPGVPSSGDICESIIGPLEGIYGPATEQEAGDGTHPSCQIDFEAHRVGVSAFSLDDPLVGGDFTAYIDSVGQTIEGLEPVDGIGDEAFANETGQGYVLLGDNVATVSRHFVGEVGDRSDFTEVMAAVADALS